MQLPTPRCFRGVTMNMGLKDIDDDFAAVVSEVPARSSAVFTRSRFAGPSVVLSRGEAHLQRFRGMVVLSRNANVATGRSGAENAAEVRRRVAETVGIPPEELVIGSTGVIGRPYPMEGIRAGLAALSWPFPEADYGAAARAIMTTDTRPKHTTATCGDAVLTGIAKGVGMIEPDMATLLTFFFTDADIPADQLDRLFRRVMDRTFNALSIDTDTSTSDTAAVFANGLAGPVDLEEFEQALHRVALNLVRDIASDGEGATKLIEVRVTGARDDAQAKRVGKAVVNSPLVKTAVHGADPNWGRAAMALGNAVIAPASTLEAAGLQPADARARAFQPVELDPHRLRIDIEGVPVFAGAPLAFDAAALSGRMRRGEVVIRVDLGVGDGSGEAFGCDLTQEYVIENSEYST